MCLNEIPAPRENEASERQRDQNYYEKNIQDGHLDGGEM